MIRPYQYDDMETWKLIAKYPDYEVSNTGLIRRAFRGIKGAPVGKILKPRALNRGHLYVNLFKNKKATSEYVHRIVALTFIGEPPLDKKQVAHWDGNPSNNHVSNLRWVNQSENEIDKKMHGRANPKKISLRKIKPDTHNIIIKDFFELGSARKVALKHGVNHQSVMKVLIEEGVKCGR